MTWIFAPDYTLVRDQIRVMIGDVISTDPLLDDAAIAFFYAQAGNDLVGGALKAAQAAAAKLAHECDTVASKAQARKSQRHAAMLDVIAQLKAEQISSQHRGDYSPDTALVETRDSEDYPDEFRLSSLEDSI